MMIRFVIYGLCFFTSPMVFAQKPSVSLKAFPAKIQIGDYVNVELTVQHKKTTQITLPLFTDVIGSLEVVEAQKTDTVFNGENVTLCQHIIASAYDSGTYSAGPVKFFFTTNGLPDSILSNQVFIEAFTMAVDTTQPFKPIKAPLEVSVHWSEFLYYIIAATLIFIGVLLFLLLRKKPIETKPVAIIERPALKEPAHVWALRELENLEAEKLWQSNETKVYYSRLTDILRLYLEYRYRWQALESTTEEIEVRANKYITKEKAKDDLLEVLRTADMVKFALANPSPGTNVSAMESAQKFVEITKQTEETQETS